MNILSQWWRSFWSSIPEEPPPEPDWAQDLARSKGIPRITERMNGLAVLRCGHLPGDWDHQFLRCSVCEQLRRWKEGDGCEREHDLGGEA